MRGRGISGFSAAVLTLVLGTFAVPPASGAEPPYEFDSTLSLIAACQVSSVDPVKDPGCEYPPPPNGPSERFREPRAVAIDPYGNVYVSSAATGSTRIDVFDDEGFFITEIAGAAAKSIAIDSDGNLYAKQEGTIVRFPPEAPYEPEAGKIDYVDPPVVVTTSAPMGAVAVDASNDHLFLTRQFEISEFKSAADGNELIESFKPEKMGNWTETLAVDAQRRRLYVSSCEGNELTNCGILVIDADTHALLEQIDGSTTPAGDFFAEQAWLAIAVDEELGYFFVGDIEDTNAIYQFNEDYEYLSEIKSSAILSNNSTQIAVSNGSKSLLADPCAYPVPSPSPGDACNRHYLFVPSFPPQNRVLAFHPPGQTPPVVERVFTGSIGETEAQLRAAIDPRGLDTEYVFEYTTQQAFEEGEFEDGVTAGKGTISGNSLPTSVDAVASGLVPGETYRFRVRADNELGAADEEGQNESAFTTYDDAPVSLSPCENLAFRIGASEHLPDCRAYELVTPSDTGGRSPKGVGFVGNVFTTIEASPAGDAVWFKIKGGALTGELGVGSFEGDPYVATRGSSGWTSALAGASGDEAIVSVPGSTSPDQGYAFWTARIEGPLVVNGENTEYLYYPDGHSELIGRGSLGTDPKVAGKLIADKGAHIVFETLNAPPTQAIQLEPNAPPTGTRAVYDRTIGPGGAEKTHVVSLLPGDETPVAGQNATYIGASKDGEGIAFTIVNTLYLRVGNETTYEVGENVEFAGVSEGGERIFYMEGGNLKALNTTGEEVIDFSASGDVIPANVATDGTRAYFVSPSVLGGTNPRGDSAQAGKQNLYLSEEGAISFVATVTDRDVEGTVQGSAGADGLGLWTEALSLQQLSRDSSRTTADGSVLLFQSRANITGYEEGEFAQVYRYDSAAEELQCISCIPTGQSASAGASIQTFTVDSLDPPPLTPYGFVPGLAAGGSRVFFESSEALVSTDTDEVVDVYEWEAGGVGSCSRPAGCVYLISSGQSARDNFLYAHSTSGDDVFFSTEDVLTASDTGGAASIYDAKVRGGFPQPAPKGDCVGEGCRGDLTPPPALPPSESGGRAQPGNLPLPKRCPKGKHKVKKSGKVVCVKKKKGKGKGGKSKQRANSNRRAGK